MRRLLVLTSPGAGGTDETTVADVVATLRDGGMEVETAESSDAATLADVLDRLAGRDLVVAGGDGSLHAVVQALHDRAQLADVTLGLVPLGTGNDFARTLGIPLDPGEAARALLTASPRRLDLLVDDDGGVVVNNVHAGAGAAAARTGAAWKARIGKAGYAVGAVITAMRPPTVRASVQVDGRTVHDPVRPLLQVAVGNGAYVGGGTALTPHADPGDGLVDVLMASPAGLAPRLAYAAGLLVGRHHRHDDVVTARGRVVTVSTEETGDELWCSADGELTGPHRRRSWRIEPAAWTLLLADVPSS